jgi:hypothetical protein
MSASIPRPAANLLQYGLLNAVRSVLVGWIALFAITALIERPLVRHSLFVGPAWVPTLRLALECLGLFAVGWLIGPWGNLGVWIFAASISVRSFGLAPGLDVPWLFRLLIDTFQNSRYLESFFTSLVTHAFLFSSLFIGVRVSRGHTGTMLHIK